MVNRLKFVLVLDRKLMFILLTQQRLKSMYNVKDVPESFVEYIRTWMYAFLNMGINVNFNDFFKSHNYIAKQQT